MGMIAKFNTISSILDSILQRSRNVYSTAWYHQSCLPARYYDHQFWDSITIVDHICSYPADPTTWYRSRLAARYCNRFWNSIASISIVYVYSLINYLVSITSDCALLRSSVLEFSPDCRSHTFISSSSNYLVSIASSCALLQSVLEFYREYIDRVRLFAHQLLGIDHV